MHQGIPTIPLDAGSVEKECRLADETAEFQWSLADLLHRIRLQVLHTHQQRRNRLSLTVRKGNLPDPTRRQLRRLRLFLSPFVVQILCLETDELGKRKQLGPRIQITGLTLTPTDH